MKIAVLGSGNMGRALGTRWAQLGHEVLFAARSADKAQAAAADAGAKARATGLQEAATQADVVFWSPRERDPRLVLSNPSVLDGKIVIDVANRSMDAVHGGEAFPTPLAQALADQMPGAKVVKAFNNLAMEAFDIAPDAIRTANAEVPIAGDDPDAKAVIGSLIEPLGFRVRDLGGLQNSLGLELLADALRLGMGTLGWRVHLSFQALPDQALGAIGARQTSHYR